MKTNGVNWMTCFYLPVAGGITLCLAILIQSVVAAEFEPQDPQFIASPIGSIDPIIECDCLLKTAPMDILRDIYKPAPRPPRLEPDKSCAIDLGFPKYRIIPYLGGYAWLLDPEGEQRRARLREAEAKRDKCPLIIRP